MTRFKSILGFVGGVGARGGNRGLSPVTMRVVRSLLAALLTGIFALPVHADTPDFDIRVSTPKTGGSIDLFLCKPDGITQCSVEDRFTRTKLLMITVSIDITDTALQKAEKIAKALNNRDPNFKAEAKRGIVEEFANVK